MPSVTLADISSRILSRVDDNSLLYAQPEITSVVNESIRVINLLTGYLQITIQFTSRPNQAWYDVPAGILLPLRVQFENIFLDRRSLIDLGQAAPNWLTENTANTGVSVAHWTTAGLDKFAIHPADSIGGNDLQITGVQEPVPLVSLSDVIQFPNEFVEAVTDMSIVALVLKEGGKIFADAQQIYQKAISKVKKFRRYEMGRMPAWPVESAQVK